MVLVATSLGRLAGPAARRPVGGARRRARRAVGPGASPGGERADVRGRHPRAVRPGLRADRRRRAREKAEPRAGQSRARSGRAPTPRRRSPRGRSGRRLGVSWPATRGFDEVSPAVGQLDESALEDLLGDSPDEALALLADLTGRHRPEAAGAGPALAGPARGRRRPAGTRPGAGASASWRRGAADESGGDLDLDASIEALALAEAARCGRPISEELTVRGWAKPGDGAVPGGRSQRFDGWRAAGDGGGRGCGGGVAGAAGLQRAGLRPRRGGRQEPGACSGRPSRWCRTC